MSMAFRNRRIPRRIAGMCAAFRAGLQQIFGDRVEAVYLHGAAAFPEGPIQHGDTDLHVILTESPSEEERRKVEALHRKLSKDFPRVGQDLDIWYIGAKEARLRRPPRHLFHPELRDHSWGLHRAHWLAGRYVLLHGLPAEKVCPPPSRREIDDGLRHEFRFAERQIRRNQALAYSVLNLARILYSLETRNIAVSKETAARWALRHLPESLRPTVRVARRKYHGRARRTDLAILRKGAPQVLTHARFVIRGN